MYVQYSHTNATKYFKGTVNLPVCCQISQTVEKKSPNVQLTIAVNVKLTDTYPRPEFF